MLAMRMLSSQLAYIVLAFGDVFSRCVYYPLRWTQDTFSKFRRPGACGTPLRAVSQRGGDSVRKEAVVRQGLLPCPWVSMPMTRRHGGKMNRAEGGVVASALVIAVILHLSVGVHGAPGTLRIGTCSEGYAPMVMRSGDGSFYGLEIDQWYSIYRLMISRVRRSGDPELQRLVGDSSPQLIPIKGLSTPEAGLSMLQQNQLDIAFCGYYLLPERTMIADPSPPLLPSGYAMVTNAQISAPTDAELLSGTFPKFQPNAVFAFLFLICISFVFAHLIWFMERGSNKNFTNTYGHGIFDGFYMAMTAASSSGYGDLVPVTFFGKVLTAAYILTGLYCLVMFAASITTGIVTNNMREPLLASVTVPADMVGKRVGTYFSAAQRTIDIIEPRVGKLIQYSSVQWAYASLARGDIDVILDDASNAQYQVARQPYSSMFVMGGEPFMPTNYGFYVRRLNATTHPLHPYLYRAVLEYSRGELNLIRSLHVGKWITDGTEPVLSDVKTRILERTLMNANLKMIAVLISVMIVGIGATFLSQRDQRERERENSLLRQALGCGLKGEAVDMYNVRVGASRLFDLFDTNGDGVLELSEITSALSKLGFNPTGLPEKLKKEAFLSGTPMEKEDGSCWLSFSDFQEVMQRIVLEGFDSNTTDSASIRGAPAEVQHVLFILDDLRNSSSDIENRMDHVQNALQDLNDLGVMDRVREAISVLKGIETRPISKTSGSAETTKLSSMVIRGGEGGVNAGGGVIVDAAIESMHGQAQRTQGQGTPTSREASGVGENSPGGGWGGRGGGKPGQLHTQALEELLMMRSATLGKAEIEERIELEESHQGGGVAAKAQRMEGIGGVGAARGKVNFRRNVPDC